MVEGRVNGGGRHLLNLRTCCKRPDTTYNEACVDIGEAERIDFVIVVALFTTRSCIILLYKYTNMDEKSGLCGCYLRPS